MRTYVEYLANIIIYFISKNIKKNLKNFLDHNFEILTLHEIDILILNDKLKNHKIIYLKKSTKLQNK